MGASAKLSPRQREVLALHWSQRATSKVIARELGIARSTVDGYFAEALEVLGARDRREAALLAFGAPPPPVAPTAPAVAAPVSAPAPEPAPAPPVLPGPPAATGGMPARVSAPAGATRWLPLRTGAHNDLSVAVRLFSIVALAVALAIGFGALASGAHVISDLLR